MDKLGRLTHTENEPQRAAAEERMKPLLGDYTAGAVCSAAVRASSRKREHHLMDE